MKFSGIRIFTFFFVLAITNSTVSAQIKPKVDERIELTSIVARLAGFNEYGENVFQTYTEKVDRHFAKYGSHPAVEFAKELRKKGIGFDAVPSFATRLSPAPSFRPRVDFAKSGIDQRWKTEDAQKFAVLLQKFYRETKCREFFRSNQEMFRIAEKRFTEIQKKVNFAWFRDFYGERPNGEFHLVVSLLNGNSNYNSTVSLPNGTEDFFAIIGTSKTDQAGLPVFDETQSLPLIIHEFGHSFNNRLIYANAKKLEKSGELIFPQLSDKMRRQGYNSALTMFIEAFLRACVIKYLEKNPLQSITANQVVAYEESIGFVWTEKLVGLLSEYERSRQKYPKLSDFMPRVIEFFDQTATRVPQLKQEFAAKSPKILETAPFPNNSSNIDENIREFRIVFDKEMQESVEFSKMDARNPFVEKPYFDKDKRTLIGKVKLEPNGEYGVVLPAWRFRSAAGYSMSEDFQLYFTTNGFVEPPMEKQFGYKIDNNLVTFVFRKPLNLEDRIEKVSVAGEFNDWNPSSKAFEFTKVTEDTYQLTVKSEVLGKPGEKKMFKFVVNGNTWIEPSKKALNVIKNDNYFNLYIELK